MSEDVNSGFTSGKFYILQESIKECQLLIDEDKLLATELPKCTAFGTVLALKWEQTLQADPDAIGWSMLKSNKGETWTFLPDPPPHSTRPT